MKVCKTCGCKDVPFEPTRLVCRSCKSRAQYRANPEKSRAAALAWIKTHPEQHQVNKARWRAANRDKHIATSRAWVQAHPERAQHNAKEWRKKNKGKLQRYDRIKRYGADAGQIHDIIVAGWPCQACQKRPAAHVDHDHTSGQVRGALCHGCNAALGYVQDDVVTLLSLIEYLHQKGRRQ